MRRLFLAYTASDLSSHALVAHEVAEQCGWTVVDHKDWEATGRPSVRECYSRVDSCNALLVLSGATRGWVPKKLEDGDGVTSITHLEVRRARSRGIPVFPLLLSDELVEARAADANTTRIFRDELKRTLARFVAEDPESVREPTRQALLAWDGGLDDDHHLAARMARIVLPALMMLMLAAWLLLSARRWVPRYLLEPIPNLSAWSSRPVIVGLTASCVVAAIAWIWVAPRTRPQLLYRVFPLTTRGRLSVATLTGCTLLLAVSTAWPSTGDPEWDAVLDYYMDGNITMVGRLVSADRWATAEFATDAEAMRAYILPVTAARSSLASVSTLADVRERTNSLVAPRTLRDPRTRLLVELASFHILAIQQDAGTALAHFEQSVQPRAEQSGALWQANALYARAAWADYWAFTNVLNDLDRTGSPFATEEDVLTAFADAEAALPPRGLVPSWVHCAVLTTRAGVRMRLCGLETECPGLDEDQGAAESCFESRKDHEGAHTTRYNRALRLLATGSYAPAFRLLRQTFQGGHHAEAGLHALGLQSLVPVTSRSTLVDAQEVLAAYRAREDPQLLAQAARCVELLRDATEGVDTQTSGACSVAHACYLTDSPVALMQFCGVAAVSETGAAPWPVHEAESPNTLQPTRYVFVGRVDPAVDANEVLDGCDGEIERSPSVQLSLRAPTIVRARVYTHDEQHDSVLVIRGPASTAVCNDDAPLAEARSTAAGVRFFAPAGVYDIYVGGYEEGAFEFDLRVELEPHIGQQPAW